MAENNKIYVTSKGNNGSVTTTNNNAKYYSDLSEEFANKSEASAKKSANSAINAQNYVNELLNNESFINVSENIDLLVEVGEKIENIDLGAILNAEENSEKSATSALNSANIATSQAEIATSQAVIATEKSILTSNYATNASQSATSAKQYATNAATSANTSTTKANEAKTSATSASQSATSASQYATNANQYATNASSSASIATTQANNAKTSETNASTSSKNAKIWAEGTDAEVQALGGIHSAKEWAKQGIGVDKLLSSKAYESNGLVLTDEQGFNDVQEYKHSTFDISKFTVIGSPTITSDGVYTCGYDKASYVKIPFDNTANNFHLTVKIDIKDITQSGYYFGYGHNTPYGCFNSFFNGNGQTDFRVIVLDEQGDIQTLIMGATNYVVGTETIDLDFNGSRYLLTRTRADGEVRTYAVESTLKPATNFFSLGNSNKTDVTPATVNLTDISITVDGKEVFNGNKTGLDIIKPDDYTVVGSPTITADGVASGFSVSDYLNTYTFNDWNLNNHIYTFYLHFPYWSNNNPFPLECFGCWLMGNSSTNSTVSLMGWSGSSNDRFAFSTNTVNTGDDVRIILQCSLLNGKNNYSIKMSVNNGEFIEGEHRTAVPATTNGTSNIIKLGSNGSSRMFDGSIDLNSFKIYVDGDLVCQACLKIPYTESKTGSKVVDAIYRDRIQDVYEQYGQAKYYTLDEENKNFTLPMGEIYGMMVSKDLSNLSEKGQAILDNKADIYLSNATKESGLRRLIEVSDPSLLPSWYKVFEETNPSTGEVKQWCEQGGVGVGGTDDSGASFFFMKGYSDAYGVPNGNINVQATIVYDEEEQFGNGSAIGVKIRFVTSSGFMASTTYTGSATARYEAHSFRWKAEGYIE